MKYYIDFEFNNYKEIISIGLIDENDREFHSYINSNNRVSLFIERLTGITNYDIKTAPRINKVIQQLHTWLGTLSTNDIFYVYGDQDIPVLQETLQRVRFTEDERKIILHIINHSIDFSNDVKTHFQTIKKIKLIDVYNYYKDNTLIQSHDALEDAIFLKYVVEKVNTDDEDISGAFIQYKTNSNYYETVKINQFNYNEELVNTFNDLNEATKWTMTNIMIPSKNKCCPSTVKRKIKDCLKKDVLPYCGFYWRISNDNN